MVHTGGSGMCQVNDVDGEPSLVASEAGIGRGNADLHFHARYGIMPASLFLKRKDVIGLIDIG